MSAGELVLLGADSLRDGFSGRDPLVLEVDLAASEQHHLVWDVDCANQVLRVFAASLAP